jgi:hypothetical protein
MNLAELIRKCVGPAGWSQFTAESIAAGPTFSEKRRLDSPFSRGGFVDTTRSGQTSPLRMLRATCACSLTHILTLTLRQVREDVKNAKGPKRSRPSENYQVRFPTEQEVNGF